MSVPWESRMLIEKVSSELCDLVLRAMCFASEGRKYVACG